MNPYERVEMLVKSKIAYRVLKSGLLVHCNHTVVYVRTSRKTTFCVNLPFDEKILRPANDCALETATYNCP